MNRPWQCYPNPHEYKPLSYPDPNTGEDLYRCKCGHVLKATGMVILRRDPEPEPEPVRDYWIDHVGGEWFICLGTREVAMCWTEDEAVTVCLALNEKA